MEQTKFLNKVRHFAILDGYRFNRSDFTEEEFVEFVESMLNASYKINKNKIFLDIEPDVAIFIYEHFMCDTLPEVGHYQTFVNDAFKSYISIYSYGSSRRYDKYENLLIPFAMSHEDIIAEVDIISSTMDRKVDTELEYDVNDIMIGKYGVCFEMDCSLREYKSKMFFQGFKQISLTK